jgi:hypothetical protein
MLQVGATGINQPTPTNQLMLTHIVKKRIVNKDSNRIQELYRNNCTWS